MTKMQPSQGLVNAVRAQFGRPAGLGGRAAGLVMAHRPSNRKRNRWTVSLLDVKPKDRVLEIGFGPGIAIRELDHLAGQGYVGGIDHSELMVRRARRLNADGIRRKVVDLRLGSVDALPVFDEPFDKILAVNSMMFWADPVSLLVQLRGILRPGGLIALAHQPRGPTATDQLATARGLETVAALGAAGFTAIRVKTLNLKPAVTCALGINGATPV